MTYEERRAQVLALKAEGIRASRTHDLVRVVLETTDEGEWLDALDELERLAAGAERLRDALREVSNAYGCFAGCAGALKGGTSHTPACRNARAALKASA